MLIINAVGRLVGLLFIPAGKGNLAFLDVLSKGMLN